MTRYWRSADNNVDISYLLLYSLKTATHIVENDFDSRAFAVKVIRDSSAIVSDICPMPLQLPRDYPNYSKKAVHSSCWCAKHCRALKIFAKLSMIENLKIYGKKGGTVFIKRPHLLNF